MKALKPSVEAIGCGSSCKNMSVGEAATSAALCLCICDPTATLVTRHYPLLST